MGNNIFKSESEASNQYIHEINDLICYTITLFSNTTIQPTIQQDAKIRMYINMDISNFDKDTKRQIICINIRSRIIQLYMKKLAEESAKVYETEKQLSKNVKLSANITGTGGGGDVSFINSKNIQNSLIFTNNFVKDFVHRSISVLIPAQPISTMKYRYNQSVITIINIVADINNNIDKFNLNLSLDINHVDDIITQLYSPNINMFIDSNPTDQNFADLQKIIKYAIKTTRNITNMALKILILEQLNKCYDDLVKLSTLSPIEETYILLSEIMKDFLSLTSEDIKYIFDKTKSESINENNFSTFLNIFTNKLKR